MDSDKSYSTIFQPKQDKSRSVDAIQERLDTIANEFSQFKLPVNANQQLREVKKLVAKVPLYNMKQTQYLHAMQLQLVALKTELDCEKHKSSVLNNKLEHLMSLFNFPNTMLQDVSMSSDIVTQQVANMEKFRYTPFVSVLAPDFCSLNAKLDQ